MHHEGKLNVGNSSQIGNVSGLPYQREYQIIGAQLESILREACREPPSGADRAQIEKRITALQCALEEAERRIREKQIAAEMSKKQKVLEHQLRRTQLNEEKMLEIRKDFERRQKLAEEMQEERRIYYNQKNEGVGNKIKNYRHFFFNAQAELIEKAEAEREKRNRILERLKEERERNVNEKKEKARRRMERCQEVLNRRKQKEEAMRREKINAYLRHEEELAKRQEGWDRIRYRVNHTQDSPSRRRNKRNGTVDTSNGESMVTRYKSHSALLRELKEKEEKHRARYEAEQAVRVYELQLRAAARQKRIEKQQQNYVDQLEKKIQRNEEIIEMAREKKRRGERAKNAREARDQEALDAVTHDIEEHRKRAEDNKIRRRENALAKNYYRWNDRAERVIHQLQDIMKADNGTEMMIHRKDEFLPQLCSFQTV